MKWEIEDIKRKVGECEEAKAGWKAMAAQWEEMWMLRAFERTLKAAHADGQEQITLPTPYNVVNLTCRLIANTLKIDCPTRDFAEVEQRIAEKKQRWLGAAWQQIGRQQGVDVIGNAKWQSCVRGYHVLEVKWIDDKLPKRLQGNRFPIMVRNLDPLNVGVKEGPLYTEYAYHQYEADRTDVRQRYPKFAKAEGWEEKDEKGVVGQRRGRKRKENVIDFWYTDEAGEVWNGVVVGDKFAEEPRKTNYPAIPIIVGAADVSFSTDKSYRSLSILHALNGVWQHMCRLNSQIATSLLWYFWPHIAIQNESGMELPDGKVRPGETVTYPPGTDIRMIQMQPNVPLAQVMLELEEKQVQESTFPGVMYGQSPGSLQAGYGVSILSNAAEGRIAGIKYGLERTFERANQLMLGLVGMRALDKAGNPKNEDPIFSRPEGVRVWGEDNATHKFFYETLSASEIDDYLENHVTLDHNIPQNDIQMQTLGFQLVNAGIISRDYYRKQFLRKPVPPDEADNIKWEQLQEDAAYKPKVIEGMLLKRFPNAAELFRNVEGTDFQAQFFPESMPPPEPQMPPPPMNGNGMMPPPMPPEMMGMPPQGMGGGPPPMQDPMMGGMPLQPGSMNVGMGMIPPQLGAQFSPEMMGMPPNDPATFQALMGRPPTPDEIARMMGG